MDNFIDINDARAFSINDYLLSVEDISHRNNIGDMFGTVLNALSLMKRQFFAKIPVPEIQVRDTPSPGAEANPFGLIIVNAGMIDHCLNMQFPYPFQVLGKDAPAIFGRNLVGELGMVWVLGHEYTHLFRFHHSVEAELGSSLSVKRAFEHDADLCATATVYRVVQRFLGGHLPDIAARRFTAFAIFWIVRSLPQNNSGAGSHPSFSERYFQIILKLITLQENGHERFDPDIERRKTQERRELVYDAAVACETFYQEHHGTGIGNYFAEWHAYFASNGHTQIISDWQSVEPVVEKYAGTIPAINPAYIALRKAKLNEKKAKKSKRKMQSAARRKDR